MKYLKSQNFKLFHTRIPIPSCLKSKNLAILGQNLQRQYKIMAVLFKMTHALPNCFMAFFLEIYFMWKAELHRGRDRVWPISQSWARLKLGAWSLELHLSLPPAWQGPKASGHLPLLSQQELDWKSSSQDFNLCSYAGTAGTGDRPIVPQC